MLVDSTYGMVIVFNGSFINLFQQWLFKSVRSIL